MYSNLDQPVQIGDDVAFGGVITNDGGFNSDTSTFTCPLTGYYYFYFNLQNMGRSDSTSSTSLCSFSLIMDGETVASVSKYSFI